MQSYLKFYPIKSLIFDCINMLKNKVFSKKPLKYFPFFKWDSVTKNFQNKMPITAWYISLDLFRLNLESRLKCTQTYLF